MEAAMAGAGDAVVRTVLDTGGGAGRDGLLRRSVEMPAGSRFKGAAGGGGELWFVITGTGRLTPRAGPDLPVRPETGVWLPPGTRFGLHAGGPDPLRLDSVRLPAGADGAWRPAGATPAAAGAAPDSAGTAPDSAGTAPDSAGSGVPLLSELADCPVEVTGDRQFRVLFGPGRGCSAATQFVGEIPPGRAPEHSHGYDEVVLILAGEGVLHAGPGDHPLAPGSSVHLPPGQLHCLENIGPGTLRVLGVFHPGGSPAAKRPRLPAGRPVTSASLAAAEFPRGGVDLGWARSTYR
jgi:mannose-6-phosphate isomerase-like protein (cupin superfamily)